MLIRYISYPRRSTIDSGLISYCFYGDTFAMPRPRKPKSQRREETITVKVTKEQKRILSAKAAKANTPVSTWLLNLGMGA